VLPSRSRQGAPVTEGPKLREHGKGGDLGEKHRKFVGHEENVLWGGQRGKEWESASNEGTRDGGEAPTRGGIFVKQRGGKKKRAVGEKKRRGVRWGKTLQEERPSEAPRGQKKKKKKKTGGKPRTAVFEECRSQQFPKKAGKTRPSEGREEGAPRA